MIKHLCTDSTQPTLGTCDYCTARALAATKGDDALDLFDLLFEEDRWPDITFLHADA